VFCKSDKTPHEITVQPEDPAGEVSGPSVKLNEQTQRYEFFPAASEVQVGSNTLTYRIGSRSTSISVTVANPQAGFTADFSRPDPSTYEVQFRNTSTEAATFRWSILPPRMATPIITTDREPAVNLPDTKPGDSLTVRLDASLNGRCTDVAEEKILLPDIPAETGPPSSEIDVLKMIDIDLTRLQKMPGDELFEVTFKSTSNAVFTGTLEFLSGLKKDLADPAVFAEYQKGNRNDELAERFDFLFQGAMELMGSFQGITALEQRQYVYLVIRMLIELLISLTAIQPNDLAPGSALLGIMNNTVKIISALLEMGVKLDPDGGLAQLLAAAQAAAEEQPNVLEVLKRFAVLIR
jgi:hypothetical protein